MVDMFYNYNAPFEEEGAYCFANVSRSVCRSIRPSVDKMVSDYYLENYLL